MKEYRFYGWETPNVKDQAGRTPRDYYNLLSVDCWQFGGLGGGKQTEMTAKYIHDHTIEQGFGKNDFRIWAGTGDEDIAFPNLTPQIEAMKNMPDLFEFSEKMGEGNLHYEVMKGALHKYEEVYQHVYNYMPALFAAEFGGIKFQREVRRI